MKFILENERSPDRSSVCALCGASIGNSYGRRHEPGRTGVTVGGAPRH